MNDPRQNKELDIIISILAKWRRDGIPNGCLCRLWGYDLEGKFFAGDVSNGLHHDRVRRYIEDWLAEMQVEAIAQEPGGSGINKVVA